MQERSRTVTAAQSTQAGTWRESAARDILRSLLQLREVRKTQGKSICSLEIDIAACLRTGLVQLQRGC
jgi:hypothetical protein